MAAELGLADQIEAAPKNAEELATSCGLHPGSLYRLLRALANFGIFAEQNDGRFAQTPMSDALRSAWPICFTIVRLDEKLIFGSWY